MRRIKLSESQEDAHCAMAISRGDRCVSLGSFSKIRSNRRFSSKRTPKARQNLKLSNFSTSFPTFEHTLKVLLSSEEHVVKSEKYRRSKTIELNEAS